MADVGVDLGEEIGADEHRLELAMIDVRGNDGAPARDFLAHELRRDERRNVSAETLAVGERIFRALEHALAPEVLALGDVDHLLGDYAGARPFELGQRLCADAAQRRMPALERALQPRAGVAVVLGLDRPTRVGFDPAALAHPGFAAARETFRPLDTDRRVGAGPA